MKSLINNLYYKVMQREVIELGNGEIYIWISRFLDWEMVIVDYELSEKGWKEDKYALLKLLIDLFVILTDE